MVYLIIIYVMLVNKFSAHGQHVHNSHIRRLSKYRTKSKYKLAGNLVKYSESECEYPSELELT